MFIRHPGASSKIGQEIQAHILAFPILPPVMVLMGDRRQQQYEGGCYGCFAQTVGKVYVLERDFEAFIGPPSSRKRDFYAEIVSEHTSGFVRGAPLGPSFSGGSGKMRPSGHRQGVVDRGGVCR